MTPWPLPLVGVVLIVLGVFALVLAVANARLFAVMLIGLGGFFLLLTWAIEGSYGSKRRKYLREQGESTDSAAADAVLAVWRHGSDRVEPKKVRDAVAKHRGENAVCPIVCLGLLDIPEPSNKLFEPEIITPMGGIGNRIFFVPIAVAIVAYFGIQRSGALPLPRIPLVGFTYPIAMGVFVGGLWLLRGVLRPTYIRLAPGIVQVLQYRYGSDNATIRSYPIDGETHVTLRSNPFNKKRWPHYVTLLRGDQMDRLDISQMRNAQNISEKLLAALFSTTPIPPLSDEHLVG